MFTGPVSFVGSTHIFARFLDGKDQVIVYETSMESSVELSMVLPVPVVQPAGINALTFIDLSGYGEFFRDLAKAFRASTRNRDALLACETIPQAKPLEIHSVGAFEASFVPQLQDFSRLDERFQLPKRTWDQFPQYANYGFAVFKLKPGKQKIHPMAFRFPTARPGELFFPTVHVHDGVVHGEEEFDHII